LEKIYAGRAGMIEQCSQIVADMALKTKDPKWALEYLKKHGDLWRDNPRSDGCDSNRLLDDLLD
jgi:hypothetical protein